MQEQTLTTPFPKPQWHGRSPGWKRRLLRALGRDVLLLVLLLLIGEGAVRLLAPQYRRYIYSDTVTGGHPHIANSLGLREREFPVQRPAGEERILCLGNSVTRGTGIAQDETYPKQLEKMLCDSEETCPWFVINAGGEGQSTDRALAFLETAGLEMGPRDIVLGFSPSMLGVIARQASGELPRDQGAAGGPQRPKNDARSMGKRILLGSYLYAFLNSNVRKALYATGVLRDRVDVPKGAVFAYAFNAPGVDVQVVEDAYADMKAGLVRLRDLSLARGLRLTILGIPPRFEISALPEDNDRGFEMRKARVRPLVRMAEYCQELGMTFVDVTPALREARRTMLAGERAWDDLFVTLDYTHLNAAGQRIVAETLLRHFTPSASETLTGAPAVGTVSQGSVAGGHKE